MRLQDLLSAAGILAPALSPASAAMDITAIACDTRKVTPGTLFVALRGHALDGHDFVPEAIAKGAVAIVCERAVEAPVPCGIVPDGRRALARLADAFHGHPSKRVKVLGITGTKGKTTTTYLVRSIIRAAGKECGLLGTIAYEAFGRSRPSSNTTPDPLEVQGFLAALDREDAGYAVMEVSSHALVQRRVEGVRFAAAAFTNLSGEHLDYHRTMDEYRAAKGILFDELAPSATACLHASQDASATYAARTKARILRFGIGAGHGPCGGADVIAEDVELSPEGARLRLRLPGDALGSRPVALALVGRHNVENALAAAALTHAVGIEPRAIVAGLEAVALVPGRLEPVQAGQPFTVLVDYAHTDDSLEKVLTAVRGFGRGKIICAFGCGGDRDRGKRPRMGRVAEALADTVVLTSDNPRSEEPLAIIDEIKAGLARPADVRVEPDRRAAIALALSLAKEGDVVLIAGKGHETDQIVKGVKHHFDDRLVAREALAALMRTAGAQAA